MTWANELMDRYFQFLKDRSAITSGKNEWVMITSPFTGLFNDSIEIYLKKENEKIILTDAGDTLSNLGLIGVNISKSITRKNVLKRILLNYGILLDGEELTVECDSKSFPQKKHNLVSAIIEVNDLYVLSKHQVATVFKEDVREFLDNQGIIYTPDFISKGSTGLDFSFDFQIAHRKEEIVIKSFNTVNKMIFSSFLFSWDDIKPVREKISKKYVRAVAFLNNSQKDIALDYVEAFESKNADVILWTKRKEEENIKKLKETA